MKASNLTEAQNDGQACDRCGRPHSCEDMVTVAERDDGSLYERTDDSFGDRDVEVCADCAAQILGEEDK